MKHRAFASCFAVFFCAAFLACTSDQDVKKQQLQNRRQAVLSLAEELIDLEASFQADHAKRDHSSRVLKSQSYVVAMEKIAAADEKLYHSRRRLLVHQYNRAVDEHNKLASELGEPALDYWRD